MNTTGPLPARKNNKSSMVIKPFVTCAACGRMGNSCCTFRGERFCDTPTLVSPTEIDRILAAFPLIDKKKAFCEKLNTQHFLEKIMDLFPDEKAHITSAYSLNKTHMELATSDTGCRFYTDTGCALPRPARPLFCRIYPFWFIHDTPMVFFDEKCLVLENCGTADDIYQALGTTPDRIRRMFIRLRTEWEITPCLQTGSPKTTDNTQKDFSSTA